MARWDYKKDIDYNAIDMQKVRGDSFLFQLLTIASFIEITSDTYAKNLSEYYDDNPKAVQWLQEDWEKEEIQHGEALKRYVLHVWPEFPWQKAYERFLELYLPLCNTGSFQPTRGLEMLARMIVETGTSTMYRAFEDYAKSLDEPVLAGLTHYIYKDEVNHYSYFDRYFKYYNQSENLGRKEILQVIVQRLKEASSEDIEMGFQSIYEIQNDAVFDRSSYELFKKELNKLAKKHYPYSMAIKMTMQPLNLNKTLETTMVPVIRGAMKVLGI
ncbi:ferritin-like domain-containing protein [Sulfurimonas sp. HSL3-2]|uniref:ferritin-like domain-containing protein n=1 Tax=Hydrocurvibacter mobilis TaxID=3131936 RepID=UPI0031F93F76